MPFSPSGFLFRNTWFAILLCILPLLLYAWFFQSISLNVNYIAFDDIMILGVIPGFEGAGWLEKWKLLTTLFPEHRLVFSRSVILFLNGVFGRVDLVWLMIIANLCWALCGWIFYRAFARLQLPLWYFVPVLWLWFNVQSFENIFWGVSSLCNFGVILFVLSAMFLAAYKPHRLLPALMFCIAATFTYGNGMMAFAVTGCIYWLAGHHRSFFITLGTAVLVAAIYFIDFTPITQSINPADPAEVRDGLAGFSGFIGSIATLSAYGLSTRVMYLAVAAGVVFILTLLFLYRYQVLLLTRAVLRKSPYNNQGALFALAICMFTAITALALAYKRIPTDTFEGMFKGRYRMYSTLWCVAMYLGFLSVTKKRANLALWIVPASILLNLMILHSNFADAVNNRRAAVVQEFNARYNADWLGIKMFSMDQAHFEKIRSYYQSSDPLAEGWEPGSPEPVVCDSTYKPDSVMQRGGHVLVHYYNNFFTPEKDYTDGAYVLLKSARHVYAAPPGQLAVPLKTTLRRGMYFSKGVYAGFHQATIEPGLYQIYLLVRKNGKNRIYCTGETWNEKL
ncbi:hypothetical protein [Dyadobacter sandarakinus]|uniref:Uncharacterized protein n=1 Tax=Dyadobacter sandarakinus TaxID=2747268 RepID=A0ABX7IAQ3_9BACT|nr:hypothetical protein [Dyadobacter sandarakinus]QRR02875.1 hypothetical protein HWI92_19145 [Dyadobacter sandarakinus]